MASRPEPFIGPRSFERVDKNLFFGRDREASDLVALVTAYPVTLLYAQSGAGKTSLLRAKLIPLLEEDEFDVIPPVRVRNPDITYVEDEGIKNIYMYNTLTCLSENNIGPSELKQMSLAGFLRQRSPAASKPADPSLIALVFDQFEELFHLYPERYEDRKQFFEQVRDALKEDPLLRVVFAMREDYIAELDPYAAILPGNLQIRFRLENLRRRSAMLAVTQPLEATVLETRRQFSSDAAQKLVEVLLTIELKTSIGEKSFIGEFVDPMQLQLVCQSLWRNLPSNTTIITEEYLEKFGNRNQALERFYEDAIRLTAIKTGRHENDLRQWCKANLITSTGTRALVHRGAVSSAGIDNQILDILEANHLIRSEWRVGGQWYELPHDRFIGAIQSSNEKWSILREQASQAASSLLQQAEQCLIALDFKNALESCQKSLSHSEEFGDFATLARALYYISKAYLYQRQYQEALDTSFRALEISKNINDTQSIANNIYAIGNIHHMLESYEEAIKYFSEFILRMPDNSVGYSARGSSYWYLGCHREAIADFTQAIKYNPDSFHGYSCRGQALAEIGEFEKALEDTNRAVELANGGEIAYALNGRALAYTGLGKIDKAFQDYKASIEANPGNAWVYYNRAQTYKSIGRLEKAIEDYQVALEKSDPRLNPFRRLKAQACLKELS